MKFVSPLHGLLGLMGLNAVILFLLTYRKPMHEVPEMWLEIGSWLHLWMPIMFAVLCWSPPKPHEQCLRLARRFLKCVGFGWLIQVVIRLGIIVPAHNMTGAEPNDGANVAMLLAGWAVAVIMAIPFVLVAIVLDWFRGREKVQSTKG